MDFFTNYARHWARISEASQRNSELLVAKSYLLEHQLFDKYTYKHGKKQPRIFSFDSDVTTLSWHKANTSRGLRSIPASSITDVTPGNDEFVCSRPQLNLKLDDPELCLTIHSHSRSLHIVAPSVKVRNAWIDGVRAFVLGQEKDFDSELLEVKTEQEKEVAELHDLVNDLSREAAEVRGHSDVLERENEELVKRTQEMEVVLYGKRALELQQEREAVWEKKLAERQAVIDRLENQVRLLTVQHHSLDSTATAKITQLEEQLSAKSRRIVDLEDEFEEFKRQMKQTFNKSLVQKVQQYRESKEALNTYTAYLKSKVQDLEKEVALWQAVVHVHVLPLFKARNPRDEGDFKAVLTFALDFMEKKLASQQSQADFVELLGSARRQLKP